jgi:cysteine rich repeat protein
MKIAPCLLAIAVLVPASVTLSSFAFSQTDTMSTVLQKLSARIQKLENACGDDIKKFCAGVTPGGGHTTSCLEAYDDQITPKCAFELDEAELDLQEIGDGLKDAFRLCQGDITKLCGETRPGEGRISACLASNKASVSQSCVNAIEKLQIK